MFNLQPPRHISNSTEKAKFRADQRTSALAPKADISRFMSTRLNKKLARHLRRASYAILKFLRDESLGGIHP